MCLKTFIDSLFSKPAAGGSGTTIVIGVESTAEAETGTSGLSLPHPEESRNDNQTLENVDVIAVLDKWLADWAVPVQYWDHWRSKISITLTEAISYPAGVYDTPTGRHMDVRPEWLNPGVIAHEQAHNSYALLTDSQRAEFSKIYTPLKESDRLIKYLYLVNTYGLTSDIEGHAEIYRYIGQSMPDSLKPFYPKLF